MEPEEKKEQAPTRILCGKNGKNGMPSADDLIEFCERLTGKKATSEEIARMRETYKYCADLGDPTNLLRATAAHRCAPGAGAVKFEAVGENRAS